jgi:hypothetical protein
MSFRILLAVVTPLALTATSALAGDRGPPPGVPEVSSNGSLAAIVAVAAIAAMIWERRRRS